jgi:hypothetical protein
VAAGGRGAYRWARRAKAMTVARATVVFQRMPRVIQGCGRGFVDHIRDYGSISLVRAFYACGRGIIERYLGKNPLGPIDR